jgi:hypothetical protein
MLSDLIYCYDTMEANRILRLLIIEFPKGSFEIDEYKTVVVSLETGCQNDYLKFLVNVHMYNDSYLVSRMKHTPEGVDQLVGIIDEVLITPNPKKAHVDRTA